MNDDYLNTVFDGDYANQGAGIFEPLTRAAGDAYQKLAARGEPYAAMGKGQGQNLRRMEMAGSFGGQMPTADALDSMNQLLGLTQKRYGATAPDPGGVEAIASKHIDRMGLMADDSGMSVPAEGRQFFSQTLEAARQNRISEAQKNEEAMFAKKNTAASRPAPSSWLQRAQEKYEQQGKYAQQEKGNDFSFTRQLAAGMGQKRFEKLVKDLSKMTAKIPVAIAKSRKPTDATAYLEHVSGFRSKKR
ncbi:MAG: hypothetical protein GX776_09675 [Oxalobacter sp.]|nr:hypothetical protein [Oxalobacter sp.]